MGGGPGAQAEGDPADTPTAEPIAAAGEDEGGASGVEGVGGGDGQPPAAGGTARTRPPE